MQARFCDKYGFDEKARQQRLALFGLAENDKLLGQLLHDLVITENKHQIIEQFYDFLLNHPETSVFIIGVGQVERLKKAHTQYLETLGIDFDQELYFENRLEVGLAHERIGLPLPLYQSAYSLLQEILISYIPDTLLLEDIRKLTLFIIKISGMDMSLATDIYHTVQVEKLTSSIISLRDEEQRLSSRIKYDTLTGATSREYLLDELLCKLQKSATNEMPACVGMIDLDYFKKINDNYGHLVGDEILKGVVRRIKSRMRSKDMIGRYGGEEFLLIFPDTKKETVIDIVERIRQNIAASPFHVDDISITVTISGGVTQIQKDDTIDSLIERADNLMYQAKNNGRNRVEF